MKSGPLRKLEVVAEPEGSVLRQAEGMSAVFFKSTGPEVYVCGSCTAVLLLDVHQGEFVGYTLQCPVCGALNRT